MKRSIAFAAILYSTTGFAADVAGMTPWVDESFESGDFSTSSIKGTGTLRWGPSSVQVTSSRARTGNYSVQFVYGPNADGEDSMRELAFRFNNPVGEVWVEYWILYPSNYYHRSQSSSSNNKFFQFNYNGAPYQMLTVESAVQGGGDSMMRRFLSTTQTPSGSNNWPVTDNDTRNFIGSTSDFVIREGEWTKVLIHYKAGTDGVSNNGRAEVWINGQLFHGLDWPFWEPTNKGWINGGYILGWSNSGYSQATTIYVDDFKVYLSEPDVGDAIQDGARPKPPTDFTVDN